MLVGQLVTLRPFERSHFENSLRWVNDLEIARMVNRYRPVTMRDEEKWYDRALEDPAQIVFAIELIQENRHIGNCGLKGIDLQSRKAELWIYVGERNVWGRGLGREATKLLITYGFQSLHLHRIWLYCPEYNERALGLYSHCGFKPEGKLREDIFQDGRYWDAVRLALLKSEWKP